MWPQVMCVPCTNKEGSVIAVLQTINKARAVVCSCEKHLLADEAFGNRHSPRSSLMKHSALGS